MKITFLIIAAVIIIFWLYNNWTKRKPSSSKAFNTKYKTYINKELVQIISNTEKPKLMTREIKILKRKFETTYGKIEDIDNKLSKLYAYVKLLENDSNEDVKNLVEKQNNVIKYLSEYFDIYSALFIDILIQIKVELLNKEYKLKIDIKDYIDEIKKDHNAAITLIKKFQSYSKVPHKETDKSITKMIDTIAAIKAFLINYQSDLMLSKISPIEEDRIINTVGTYSDLIGLADNLDQEFERFMLEKSMTGASG